MKARSILIFAAVAAALIFTRKRSTGVGSVDEYVIMRTRPDGYYNGVPLNKVEVFCGYSRPNGEKWARWCDPFYRWGMEYDEKMFKTLRGAEAALQELVNIGEDRDVWANEVYELEIITWAEYVRRLNR